MRTHNAAPIFVGFALLLLGGLADGQSCTGHGTVDPESSRCRCVNSHPDPLGDVAARHGWVGELCNIPVHGVRLAGADLASSSVCGEAGCGHLAAAGNEVCFYAHLPWAEWSYLALLMNHTAASADADLYGFMVDAAVPTMYPVGDHHSPSFSDEAVAARAMTVAKADIHVEAQLKPFDGVFLCVVNREVHGNGNTTSSAAADFNLYARPALCPSAFRADGTFLLCSTIPGQEGQAGAHATGCSAAGVCECAAAYQPPPGAVAPEKVGFESCSALVVSEASHLPGDGVPRTFAMAYDQQVQTMTYFKVTVPHGYAQILVLAEVEDVVGAQVMIVLKHAALPGHAPGQYDVRSEFVDHKTGMNDRFVALPLGGAHAYGDGDWWVGVYVMHAPPGHDSVKYDIAIDLNACENDCNGQGQCVSLPDGTHKCQCDAAHTLVDCSGIRSGLQWGEVRADTAHAGSVTFWRMDAATLDSLGAVGDFKIAVNVTAVHQEGEAHGPGADGSAGAEIGEVTVLFGDITTGSEERLPKLRQALRADRVAELHVCDSLVPRRAAMHIGVRVLSPSSGISYTVQVVEEDGCREDSLKPEDRPASHGTCWHKCVCRDGGCAYEDSCFQFTCFNKSDSGFRYRLNPALNECVQDTCLRDNWLEYDSHVCLEKCYCPSDGTFCFIVQGCHDPKAFSCKPGYVPTPGKSLTCEKVVQPPSQTNKSGIGGFQVFLVSLFTLLLGWVGHYTYVSGWCSLTIQNLWRRQSQNIDYVEMSDNGF